MTARRTLAGLLAAAGFLLAAPAAFALDGGRLGEVQVDQPAGPVRGLVVVFSDEGGPAAGDRTLAHALAKAGAIVVGVDTPAYLAKLARDKEPCHMLFADVEAISRQLQRERGADVYLSPIVAGTGTGAALARIALSQAPANTIAGAALARRSEPPATAVPFCAAGSGLLPLGEAPPRPGPLQGFLETDNSPGAGPEALVPLVEPHLGSTVPRPGDVSSLPLIELPAPHPSDRLAIVVSGDGGWRDIDKTIAEALNADGISVVGWDSLRYFWREKTPEQTAADLAAIISTYRERWKAREIALVGYSFGADILPFAVNRLPPEVRQPVSLVALLGFSTAADFEISVTGWLGAPPTDAALPTAPEVNRLPASLLLCFYGADEGDSGCPALAARGVETIRTSGGHHFDGNYAALAARINEAWQERSKR